MTATTEPPPGTPVDARSWEPGRGASGNALARWLARAPASVFTAYAVTAAFGAYFCMYAFRKPFAVGTFTGEAHLGALALSYKTLYVIAQVLGYAASKLAGVKVIAELRPDRRVRALFACIGVAEAALVGFALVPQPWGALALMLNGFPLGLVWGLVFGFLEGRRVSDLLGAGLCASFIVASGFVKTAGKLVLGWGVSEAWMPAATGALFAPALALFVVMLAHIPPPTPEDEARCTKRAPMNASARKSFLSANIPGLVALIAAYVLLTAYRDFRDNFAREIWDALGYGNQPAILTTAELPVAFLSLLAVALLNGLRDNRRALAAVHLLMLSGAVLMGGSTLLFQAGAIGPATWMIAVGLGLYLGYVPYNCVLFDRLIGALGSVANAGFLIYVADASGYGGSVALLLYKSFGQPDLSWLGFLQKASLGTATVAFTLQAAAMVYFWRRTEPSRVSVRPAPGVELEA